MLLTFFSFVMGIYGNLVLGPSVEQWRTFGQSMRNLVPMLRRPDAFNFEAAQAVDDTALAVYAPTPTPPPPPPERGGFSSTHPRRRRTARIRRAGGASWRRERTARRTVRADGASWRRERTVRDGRCERTARVGGARGGGQADGRDGE